MAKTKFVPKEAKRSEKIQVLKVKFLVDFNGFKKGATHQFGLDTAIGLALRNILELTEDEGKKVLKKVNEEDAEYLEKAKAKKSK